MKESCGDDVFLALVEGASGLRHMQLESGCPLLHDLAVATLEAEGGGGYASCNVCV